LLVVAEVVVGAQEAQVVRLLQARVARVVLAEMV
jgi:hypothetical protein